MFYKNHAKCAENIEASQNDRMGTQFGTTEKHKNNGKK